MLKQEFKVTAYTIEHEELMKAVLQIAGIENGKLMITTSDDGKYTCRVTTSEPIAEQ